MERLIVPDDERTPVMAFETSVDSADDRLVVIFKDGSMGILGDHEEGSLRGGTSYNRLYRNVEDIRSEPRYKKAEIDLETWVPTYYKSQIPVFAIAIVAILASLMDTRLAFSSYTYGFLFFPIAVGISWYPERKLIRYIGSKEMSEISIDIGEAEPILLRSMGRVPKASRNSQVVGFWQRLALGSMFFLKISLPVLTLEGSTAVPVGSALVLALIGLAIMPVMLLLARYERGRKPGEGEVTVEHATTSQVYEFVRKRYLASSLEGLLKLKGESKKVEFKSSLWYDYHKADPDHPRYEEGYDHTNSKWKGNNHKMSMNVVKTVAGFLNAGIAGTLLIGVDDDSNILGMERDFELCAKGKNAEDDFVRKLEDILEKNMETDGDLKELWNICWLGEDARVLRLDTIEQDEAAVWVKTEKGKTYYIRRTSRTAIIEPGIKLSKELLKFGKS